MLPLLLSSSYGCIEHYPTLWPPLLAKVYYVAVTCHADLVACQILRRTINIRLVLPTLPTTSTRGACIAARGVSLTTTTAAGLVLHLADTFGEWGSFAGTVDACRDGFLGQKWISIVPGMGQYQGLGDGGLTSESPLGAPAVLFSPDSIALSEATVGPSSNSPPRGMVSDALLKCIDRGDDLFVRRSEERWESNSYADVHVGGMRSLSHKRIRKSVPLHSQHACRRNRAPVLAYRSRLNSNCPSHLRFAAA